MSKPEGSPPRPRAARLRQGVIVLAVLAALAAVAALVLVVEMPSGTWYYPALGGAGR